MVDCSIVKFLAGLVVEVLLVWTDGFQQLQDIVGVQSAGLCGHAAGQVGVTYVSDSLVETENVINL